MKNMKELYVTTRDEWREWLARNHDRESGIWLIFYKKHTQMPTLEYDTALEEALCFGWIDSIIRKLDDERYARKMTSRNSNSRWSELNKSRVRKLIEQGLMMEPGLAKIEQAKKSGLWEQSDRPQISFEIPKELEKAFKKNKKAKAFFDQLAPTYQKHFIGWIAVAKQQKTKNKRVKESIGLLEKGEKLGMK